MKKEKSILIVDDDKIITDNLSPILAEEGYTVVAVNNSQAAVEESKKHFLDAVIIDLALPDIGGIDLLRLLHAKFPEACYIIFTGYASLSSAVEALKAGASDYIIKPFDTEHLKLVVKRGIERQELAINNKILVERLEKEKQKLEVTLEACSKISGILDLDCLADFITENALKILEAEKASLMMVDEEAQELLPCGFKEERKGDTSWRKKIGDLVVGWVAKEGEALLVKDIETHPRLKQFSRKEKYKSKSFVCMPLKKDGQVIGVLSVTDKLAQSHVFTDEDLRYLSLLAHQAAAQIENIRLCEKLASFTVLDPLTDLYNFRYSQEKLGEEITRAKRYGEPLSIAVFDIDYFKTYNEKCGHDEGDKAMKKIASCIKQNSREADIVCRIGRDEFIVILPSTDTQGARVMAEKVAAAVKELNIHTKETERPLRLTVCAGISCYKGTSLSRQDFIAQANQALYKAKAQGKGNISVFE